MTIFIELLFKDPRLFFLILLAVVPSICLHEYAHAYMALLNGDSTAARAGHLTLNPLKQMGVMSIVMFLLIGIAWGAVPVNPYAMNRRGRVLTSLAGPLLNLTLFLFSWVLFAVLIYLGNNRLADPNRILIEFVMILGAYNFVLFLLNMLPIPGLDGWNVLSEFKRVNLSSEFVKGVTIFLMFAVFMGFQYLYAAGFFLMKLAGDLGHG